MRLGEIINRSNVEYRPANVDELAETVAFLKQDAVQVSSLVGKYSIWKRQLPHFGLFYFIQAGNEVAGWVGLKPRALPDRSVYSVELIFFIERYRGTKAIPMLLHAVRSELDAPIMVDSRDAIFKGGAELLAALAKRKMIKLTALKPNGQTVPVTDLSDVEYHDALLIEDAPPLSIPHRNLLGQPDGQLLIDWYDESPVDEIVK